MNTLKSAIATLASLPIIALGAAPANLLENAGFETQAPGANTPPGWNAARGAPLFPGDKPHSGKHHLRLVDPDQDASLFFESERVHARPGGKYTASAWVRTSEKGSPGVYINFYDNVGTRIHHKYVRTAGPTDGWVRATVTETAPDAAVSVTTSLYSFKSDRGTFDFDDVELSVTGGRDLFGDPRVKPTAHKPIDIGTRRELFVDDFVHWSTPVVMPYRQLGAEAPVEHLYTNQTHPYFRAPHIYLSIAARFMPKRQVLTEEQALALDVNPGYFKDTSDAILMTSRPGHEYFDRTVLSSFVRPGIGARNWVSRTNYPARGLVQTGPAEMSVYLNQDYAQPTAHLRRYSLRLDGLMSLKADYGGGEILTKPFIFDGKTLAINFATSAAGGIRIEIQDAKGKPYPGFSIADCREQIGNEIERQVTWNSDADLATLAGKPVRLRILMKDADLYSFRFHRRSFRSMPTAAMVSLDRRSGGVEKAP